MAIVILASGARKNKNLQSARKTAEHVAYLATPFKQSIASGAKAGAFQIQFSEHNIAQKAPFRVIPNAFGRPFSK